MSTDVFLSYAHADERIALAIIKALEEQNWSVFWDHKLRVGVSWLKQLERQLDQARSVLVLWTQSSVNSDWVLEEALRARSSGKLLSVTLGDQEPPFGFTTVQAVKLLDWDGTAVSLDPILRGLSTFLRSRRDLGTFQEPAEVRRVAIEILNAGLRGELAMVAVDTADGRSFAGSIGFLSVGRREFPDIDLKSWNGEVRTIDWKGVISLAVVFTDGSVKRFP